MPRVRGDEEEGYAHVLDMSALICNEKVMISEAGRVEQGVVQTGISGNLSRWWCVWFPYKWIENSKIYTCGYAINLSVNARMIHGRKMGEGGNEKRLALFLNMKNFRGM